VVDVDDDHLRGAPRRPAGLDGAGGGVADLEEGEEAGAASAPGQRLFGAAQRREIGSRARTIFEQQRLATSESVTDWMKQACGCGRS
jgi:hypothetical protein